MSELAEYARILHEKESSVYIRKLEPIEYPSHNDKLSDIRAVVCDIYGTVINYWRPGFEDSTSRTKTILRSFRNVADRFGMTTFLEELNPSEVPEKTLNDFYNGLIALNHEKAIKKGTVYPEVKIEDIWKIIITILQKHGYNSKNYIDCSASDFPRFVAFTYNFFSLGRQLYPGVATALSALKESNISIGIVSNAQFYTPIDLTLLFREQSKEKIEDYNELFDTDLTFFSYEYGVAKPNQILFRKLFDVLYEYQILPSQTVFIGNDLSADIQPASEVGMKTALFTGDKEATFFGSIKDQVIPDITFNDWSELPSKISFYSEGAQK